MATHQQTLTPIHYDSDSGADSDVPGSLTQRKKMNDAHARSLAHRFVHAPIATQDRGLAYQEHVKSQSKLETTFDAQTASVTTTVQDPSYTNSNPLKQVETFGLNEKERYRSNETQPYQANETQPYRSNDTQAYRSNEKQTYRSNETQPFRSNDVQQYWSNRTSFPAMNTATENIPTVDKQQGTRASYIQQHKRSKSDSGPEMQKQANTFNVQASIDLAEDSMLFCNNVSKKLLCMMCTKVFKEPVITSCGHTFCRQCVISNANAVCPSDGIQLVVVVANLAVSEQIGELFIHCKYGCTPSSSGIPGSYEINPNACPVTMKICNRREHELSCQYAPVHCPNSSLCPSLVKMELDDHLVHCHLARCPHARFNCKFEGTSDELLKHLKDCRFEGMKDFLEHTEGQIQELKQIVIRKDQETDYMRGLFSKLTEKIERLEKAVEVRIDLLDENLTKLSSDFTETRRCLGHIEKEISSMDSRQFNVGAFDVQSVLKCKGTFVGHQGPVWSLCVFSSLLFSGSSDNSIKVWDTRSNYKCINTFAEHSGMVLALCAYRGKLYSGSADCTVSVFDIENQKMSCNFTADDNPICTLAVGNGMLFSGSLKSIKAWELEGLKFIRLLGGLNHWIRALCTTENYLYCGSYQTIKIWDLKTLEQVRVIQTPGGSVYSLVVSREYIVCGTYENCIHVWDVKTYKSVARLTGHSGTVYDLVLMTLVDTNRVISASYDGSLRVWSLDNMQCVQTLFRHQGSVTTLAVSRGRLFSGSVDSTVKVWS